VGRFYPVGMQASRMLPYYARRFDAVEAHGTYRRHPTARSLERWCQESPASFRFAPKAHLTITHQRDLEGLEDRVAAFVGALAPLGGRMGPLLVALPHRQPDLGRLDRLLAAFSAAGGSRLAFGLGPEWVVPAVLDRLEAHECTLALVDSDGRPAPDLTVGPFTYIRLRRSRYTRADLDGWADQLAKARADGRDSYLFFKHDEHADGPRYARRLMGRLQQAS
jgi:uncharacterized protein YecE (DUF72 family)